MTRPTPPTGSTATEPHECHYGNHQGYACGFTEPHCWQCGEPWPCRAIADEWHSRDDGPRGVGDGETASPSVTEPETPAAPRTERDEIARIIVQFGYSTIGVTPTVQAATALASLIVTRKREAAAPPQEAGIDAGLLRDALVALEREIDMHPYEADAPTIVLSVRDRLRARLAAGEPDGR